MIRALALIFGESQNDTRALKHLLPALLSEDKAPDCRAIREPGTLSRGAAAVKRKKVAVAIAIIAAKEAKKRTVAVVAHEDCDACEDAHVPHAATIVQELTRAGIENPVPAVPAWEMETWWMLFPEALKEVRRCWATVDYSKRRVGLIENSKEELTADLRPGGKSPHRCPDYAESDSERIAEEIARLGLGRDEARIRRSSSLLAFKNALEAVFDPPA